jgi:hypothetical protein
MVTVYVSVCVSAAKERKKMAKDHESIDALCVCVCVCVCVSVCLSMQDNLSACCVCTTNWSNVRAKEVIKAFKKKGVMCDCEFYLSSNVNHQT